MKRLYTLLTITLIFLATACSNEQYQSPINNVPQDTIAPPVLLPCNGHPELCGLKYNEVAYAGTHNSYNYELGPVNFLFPNQDFPIDRQLNDGIRVLLIDIWNVNGLLYSHHAPAEFLIDVMGKESLHTNLKDIKTFLTANPREVLTIIIESDVAGSEIEAAFKLAGLVDLIHTQQLASDWPTLEEMIDANKRLVIFTGDQTNADDPAWYHYAYNHIGETGFEALNQSEWSCDADRGSLTNSLYQINHWVQSSIIGIGLGTAVKDSAKVVNEFNLMSDRVNNCMSAAGKLPNFIVVDFYNYGGVFEVVDELNGVNK